MKRLSPPIQVVAWLHLPAHDGTRAVRLPAEADEHNSLVVHLRGRFQFADWTCHVWASAVTRIEPRRQPIESPLRTGADNAVHHLTAGCRVLPSTGH